jgi:DNA-binding Lrp family transcriptional regulator
MSAPTAATAAHAAGDATTGVPPQRAALDDLDRRILNRAQQDLPLVAAPFAAVAVELGIEESELLARLCAMKERGDISRVGPMYRVDGFGGGLALMAMAVPRERFEEVAAAVNAMPEVAHNYEREHALNMWFVVAAETPAELAATVDAIEAATGLEVHAFPKEREYFLELKLDV